MNPYKILLETFGEQVQLDFAIEEMAELTKAICKYKRKISSGDEGEIQSAINNMQEEIADVMVNMDQLCFMYGKQEIENIKKQKIERALNRAKAKISDIK